MTEDQAEAVVDAVRQTADLPDLSHLATKADLQTTRVELVGEIATAKAELRGEIKAQKGELIWWIIGTGIVSSVAHLFIK